VILSPPAFAGRSPLAVSYPTPSCGANPVPGGRAVPLYALRWGTPAGLPLRAERAGRAVGAAWLPAGGAGGRVREVPGKNAVCFSYSRSYALDLLKSYRRRPWHVHLPRYEDLILRPVETLIGIFEYLDLDRRPATVEGLLRRASQEIPQMQDHLTSPDPERSIGRWRHDLDASSQAICQEAFGDILRECGYNIE
jgi:hypothetical protein